MTVTANATLTEIRGPGTIDLHGRRTADGAVLWTGRAAAYLKRVRRMVLTTGMREGMQTGVQAMAKTDVLWLLGSTGAPVVEQAGPDWEGSTVTVEDNRTGTPVTRVFQVLGMENRAAGTIVDNVRLELGTPTSGVSTGG